MPTQQFLCLIVIKNNCVTTEISQTSATPVVTVKLCRCRRFRSITKQFFRKADGVVLMYDVTVEESFRAVKPWLTNVQV